mmetsp:Transcript_40951/g.65838  ORF Transcript_40951/g.65838 Transcript_40951/m.65838 type:complete len:220 (+) Transcript_40951:1048-1707(+)
MLQRLQYFSFGIGMLHLMLGDQRLLLQDLHREYFARVLLANLHHFAKRAASNHLEELKVVRFHLLFALDQLSSHLGLRGIVDLVVIVVFANELLVSSQALLSSLQTRHILCYGDSQHGVLRDAVDGQFLALFAFIELGEHSGDTLLLLGFVAIVVFLGNVDGELLRGSRHCDGDNLFQIDAALAFANLFRFQVVQRFVRQQQDAVLLFAALVDLDQFHG